MKEIEYELTYLAKEIPSDIEEFDYVDMVNVYFPTNRNVPSLRVRKVGNKFTLTKKVPVDGEDASKQLEENIDVDEKEYEALVAYQKLRVSKRRYFYKYKGVDCEIDVHQENLTGLVVVDFEFKSEEDMENFEIPDFCLADVTQERSISAGFLAGVEKYEDLKELFDKYDYKKLE